MFRASEVRLLCLVVAACLVSSSTSFAGWVCIKNDTKQTLIIQEVTDGLIFKRGKVVRLLPGEVYREFQTQAGEKKIQIFDSRALTKPVYQGKMTWHAEDLMLKVETKTEPDNKDVKWALVDTKPPAETIARAAAPTVPEPKKP